MASVSEALTATLTATRGSDTPAETWRAEVAQRLRGPLLQAAADALNEVLWQINAAATDGLVSAVQLLTEQHLDAIAAYADLIDGVIFRMGVEWLE